MDIGIILCFQTFTEYALKKLQQNLLCFISGVHRFKPWLVSQLSGVVFIVVYNRAAPSLCLGQMY